MRGSRTHPGTGSRPCNGFEAREAPTAAAVKDPAVMAAADPLIDAFYDETVGSEAYVAHRLHLLEILETKHPLFFQLFGSRAWLVGACQS